MGGGSPSKCAVSPNTGALVWLVAGDGSDIPELWALIAEHGAPMPVTLGWTVVGKYLLGTWNYLGY